jgi:hypothetical protein
MMLQQRTPARGKRARVKIARGKVREKLRGGAAHLWAGKPRGVVEAEGRT